jgi:hypothetical protein
MSLYNQIIESFPELAETPDEFRIGSIELQDDGDGAYIKRWEYSKPLPDSLKQYLAK